MAIVLPKCDAEASKIAALSFSISLFSFCFVLVIFLFIGPYFVNVFHIKDFEPYLLFIPFAMLFLSWVQIFQQWLVRNRQFKSLSKAALAQSLIENFSKVTAGLWLPSVALLIGLSTVGALLYTAILSRPSFHLVINLKAQRCSLESFKRLLFQYKDFPAYRMPQNIINAASQSLPVLMIAALFGPGAAGFYALAKMVMGAPSALLGKAVTDVFYPVMVEAYYGSLDITSLLLKGTFFLFLLGMIPFGVILWFGPELFELVFGDSWMKSGEYARWLAVFFLFGFANKPCVAAVPVLGLQRGLLVYEVFSTGIKAVSLVVGFYVFKDDLAAVALFSISGAVAYICMMAWILLRSLQRDINNEAGRKRAL